MTRGKSESLITPQSAVLLLLEGLLFTQNFMGCHAVCTPFSLRSTPKAYKNINYLFSKKTYTLLLTKPIFGIFNFLLNRFTNISTYIYNIYTITQIYFSIMSIFKSNKRLVCRNSILITINTLQNIISFVNFKFVINFPHFIIKFHTTANCVSFHIITP